MKQVTLRSTGSVADMHLGAPSATVFRTVICQFTAIAPGLLPGWGTKILQTEQHSQKEKVHLQSL